MELPIASNCNILLADKNGKMVVVECTPDKKNIREAITLDNGSIVCTVNSFTSDEYASYDDSNGDDYDSAKRYKVVMNSFIDKIYIGKPERLDGKRVQEVKIIYKLIGAVDIPQ